MCKKKSYKRKQAHRKRVTYNSNAPYKLASMGIKAATGVAVLGITTTALTSLKP